MGTSESKDNSIENDGVVNSNLMINNEVKTTNDDAEFLLKLSLAVQCIILTVIILRYVIKSARRNQRNQDIILERRNNA